MMPNWAGPLGSWEGFRSTAARVTGWRDLLEQFQIFSSEAVFLRHETGGVAARPRQTVNEAGGDRIGDGREHDRHGAGHL